MGGRVVGRCLYVGVFSVYWDLVGGWLVFLVEWKRRRGAKRKKQNQQKKPARNLPDRLRLRPIAVLATLRSFGPDRSGTVALSPRQSGRAWRSDQSRRSQRPASCSWHRHTEGSARARNER